MSKMSERKKGTKPKKNLAKMKLKPIPYDEELLEATEIAMLGMRLSCREEKRNKPEKRGGELWRKKKRCYQEPKK